MKSGDMQIIGSLLYLVTVGVWVNENMDQPTQIGWALIVSICGKLSYFPFERFSFLTLIGQNSFRIVPWFDWRDFNSMGPIKKQQIRYK